MSGANSERVALVTGANRGLELEVSRQLAERGFLVCLGVRNLRKGEQAARSIGGEAHPVALDVANPSSPGDAVREIERCCGRLDVLVNNAAIPYDTGKRALDPDWPVIREAFEINVVGAWRVATVCSGLLTAGGHGRLVNVSYAAGSLASMGAGTLAYAADRRSFRLTLISPAELTSDAVRRWSTFTFGRSLSRHRGGRRLGVLRPGRFG